MSILLLIVFDDHCLFLIVLIKISLPGSSSSRKKTTFKTPSPAGSELKELDFGGNPEAESCMCSCSIMAKLI